MSCDQCLRLISGTPIKLPTDLKRAIKKADEAVKKGVLKYEGAGQLGEPFEELARGSHWGDVVDNYFSCTSCGQKFNLYAETYHGAGGAFEKIACIKETLQGDTYGT
ncbi:MAG: hypothetical protein JAY97_08335 [Candidatus Thiodiazotropha sp. 'RUGA']|nr:hypothetical protein [Candidatus Thiodiazotropha sp. 'RUGA']